MASVNKQHEELFDAYKLGRLKKNPLSVYPASDGLCDFQHRRGCGDGGEGGDYGGTLGRERRRGRADCGRKGRCWETSTVMAYVVLVIVLCRCLNT